MTALFDMDGTLFAGDSQLRFARWLLRRHGWRRLYLLLVLPCGLLRGLRLLSGDLMKRAFLSFAWNLSKEELQKECEDFVQQELLPATFPELLQRLRKHQKEGDVTVLCSASPDVWVRLLGERLGFTYSIGTPVEIQERVPLFPRLSPPGNNKGEHKITRLRRLGIAQADIGYTDSAADLPMLSLCRKAVLVHPAPRLQHRLPEAECLTPPRPGRWSRLLFPLRCVMGI